MSKVDDLQKKYPDIDVRSLATADPSPTKKYVPWMVKQVLAEHGSEYVSTMVELFHSHVSRLQKKDINAYASVDDVNTALGSVVYKAKDTSKLYEDKTQVVIRPDTFDATRQFGRNTNWCITQSDGEHYSNYTDRQNAVFYFVVSKTRRKADPLSRIALAIFRTKTGVIREFCAYNAADTRIYDADLKRSINSFPAVLKMVKVDAKKRPLGIFARIETGKASKEELDNFCAEAMKMWSATSNNAGLVELASAKGMQPNFLTELANINDYSIKCRVIENKELPLKSLEKLTHDSDYYIAHRARSALSKRKRANAAKRAKLRAELAKLDAEG